jgi:RimJ/RimL family protein N-acetyltransferase
MSSYLLRCWRGSDAPAFRAAVDESLYDLKEWMNWAYLEPASVEATALRLREYESDFRLDVRWRYAIVDVASGRILGGASVHPRIGEGGREVGYWLRESARGHGIATAAVKLLTQLCFEQQEADRVEIHCDRGNDRSAAVPLRLGFKLVGEYLRTRPQGEQRISRIFRLERAEFPTPRMLTIDGLPSISVEQ